MDVFLEVKKALESITRGKEINKDTLLKDLGVDSIDLLSLVVDVEEKFDVQVDAEQLRNVKTVADVVILFEETIKK